MLLVCSECRENLCSPYIALISGFLEGNVFREGRGLGICQSHLPSQAKRASDGLALLLTYVHSETNQDGTINHTMKEQRGKVLGCITPESALEYFPRSYQLIKDSSSPERQ